VTNEQKVGVTTTAKQAATQTADLPVAGMDCPSCVVAIEGGLETLPGVENAKVDMEAGCASVRYDPARVGVDALAGRIEELGFEVTDNGSDPAEAGRRPFIPAPLVFGAIALLLPLAIVFRDEVRYMGGLNTLFTPGGLEDRFDEASFIAIGFAFVIGVAVFFSPGILAITSAITGYVSGTHERSRLDVLRVTSGFAIGLIVVDAALGALFALGGKGAIRWFGDNLPSWNLLLAVVLLGMGLILLRVWRPEFPFTGPKTQGVSGFKGALALAVPFALLDCPACTPLLLPVALGAAATGNPLYGAAIMGAYGLGRGVLLMGVGTSAGLLKQTRGFARHMMLVEAAGGVVLVLAGLYFFKEFLRLATVIGL